MSKLMSQGIDLTQQCQLDKATHRINPANSCEKVRVRVSVSEDKGMEPGASYVRIKSKEPVQINRR
jgi:hypothetical protein